MNLRIKGWLSCGRFLPRAGSVAKKPGIALVLHVRDFDRDFFAAFAVGRPINHRHSTAADDFRDLETVVNDLSRKEFASRNGLGLFVVYRSAAIIADCLDTIYADAPGR